MKTAFSLLILSLILTPSMVGQEMPDGDMFFGYSFLRTNSSDTILAFTSVGGVATVGMNVNNHIGIEAEVSGYHNGFIDNYHLDTNSVTYLFGPRFSYGRTRRVDPYVHVLVGGIHTATSAVFPLPLLPTPLVDRARVTVSQDGFSMAVGGGLDIRLSHWVLFRPFQIDYLLTRLGDIGFTGLSRTGYQSNVRYAVGFVFNITD